MRIEKISAIATFVICLSAQLKSGFADNPTLEKALDEFKFSTALVQSYDLYLAGTVSPKLKIVIDRVAHIGHYEQFEAAESPKKGTFLEHQAMMRFTDDTLLDREKHLIEAIDPETGNPSRVLAFDGKTYIYRSGASASVSDKFSNGYSDGRFHYSHLYLNACNETTFAKLFESRSNVKHIDDAALPQSYVIETAPEANTEKSVSGFRVWLDPRNGFLPTRIDWFMGDFDTLRDRIEITEVKKIPGGIAVPTKAVVTHFDSNKKSKFFGHEAEVVDIAVDTAKSTWNRQIDASKFEIVDFPPGTHVIDSVHGKRYQVPKPDDQGEKR